ncbi:squalene/phytoene synthase family protein [Sphingosinicella sp. LHD-64]|uniref:squalene/phytoene synthase family protein n=1 Tax=Sphingosinicella sp. LHD-64 TaxID=3072139 RepID=UPI00280EAD9C|nr:squalene/phytoene synthase family protein [Sphingosinicella sp. LHD-64]MDQ8757749.1 squalene/phytoene synthase family protein [Sphingosinicella sp. LHD-64]
MADLDPDRALALAYVPAAKRPALEALWRLDAALGSVLATGSEPMVTRIRLAWWREALERLDREAPPPEPLLQALAVHVLPAGITGDELAAMEEGWEAIVAPGALAAEDLEIYARARGAILFRLSARLLGRGDFSVGVVGERWAMVDLARHSSAPTDVRDALTIAREKHVDMTWPSALRPLGMLAILANRDLSRTSPERAGSPKRMMRMALHRMTGR